MTGINLLLKLGLVQTKEQLHLRILEQSSSIITSSISSGYPANIYDAEYSDEWSVWSNNSPELSRDRRIIYIRGANKRMDDCISTRSFGSPAEASDELRRIIHSLQKMSNANNWYMEKVRDSDGVVILIYESVEIAPAENLCTRDLFEPEE